MPQFPKRRPRQGQLARPLKVRPDRQPATWTAAGQITRAAAGPMSARSRSVLRVASLSHLTSVWSWQSAARRVA